MKFKIGRSNLAATIYVPYDCGNNCPFCTSKKMYEGLEPNMELLFNNIRLINKTKGIKDVVITGGEPFANLEILQVILDSININKSVYINTTLPFKEENKKEEIKRFLNKNKNVITSLNISRHISVGTINDDNDDFINSLPIDFRINSVLFYINYDSENLKDKVIGFIKRFPRAQKIAFRADYRGVSFRNLKTLDHPFIDFAINQLHAEYLGSSGCQVCNDDSFIIKLDDKKFHFSLHRGMEHSSIQLGNTVIVNDVVMMPDSHMYYDWDKKRPTEEGKKMLDVLKDLGYEYRQTFITREYSSRQENYEDVPYSRCGIGIGRC